MPRLTRYLYLSDSIAFLESLTLARNFGPIIFMTILEMLGMYWLPYMRGKTGLKQIQDSGSLLARATKDSWAHLSPVILLSVDFMLSPNSSPAFSVAATSSKLENVGPGHSKQMSTPLPTFSFLRD